MNDLAVNQSSQSAAKFNALKSLAIQSQGHTKPTSASNAKLANKAFQANSELELLANAGGRAGHSQGGYGPTKSLSSKSLYNGMSPRRMADALVQRALRYKRYGIAYKAAGAILRSNALTQAQKTQYITKLVNAKAIRLDDFIQKAAGQTQRAIADSIGHKDGLTHLFMKKASLSKLPEVARFIANQQSARQSIGTLTKFISAIRGSQGNRNTRTFLNKLIKDSDSQTRQVLGHTLARGDMAKLFAGKVSPKNLPEVARIIAKHTPSNLKSGTMDAFLSAIPKRTSFARVLEKSSANTHKVIALAASEIPPLAEKIGKHGSLKGFKKLSQALIDLKIPKKKIGQAFQEMFGAMKLTRKDKRKRQLVQYFIGKSNLLERFLETQFGLKGSRFLQSICHGQTANNAAAIYKALVDVGELAKSNPAVSNPNHLGVWQTTSKSRTRNSSRTLSTSITVKGHGKGSVGVAEGGGEVGITAGGAWSRGKTRTRGSSRRVDLGARQIHGRTVRNRAQSGPFFAMARSLDRWAIHTSKNYRFSTSTYRRKKQR